VSDDNTIRGPFEPTIPSIRDLVIVLFRQRKAFLGCAGLVLGIAVLYAIAGTTYQAKMKVLIRRGRADAPVSAVENAPLDLTRTAVSEEELNSEVQLLRDDEVLRGVVEQTGVGGRDWFHFLRLGETKAQRVEREARRLGKAIKVEPIKRTNLIAVTYQAADPSRAAQVLRSLADVYLEKHMAVHRPTGEGEFFAQQTAEARQRLEESNRRLLDFMRSNGIVAAAQQRDLALQKLNDFDAGKRQTRIELAETEQRLRELRQELAALPERATTQIRTADNPELQKALKSRLVELQLKRTELLVKFEPGHRLLQEVEKQISQVQAAIAAENLAPVRDETTDRNPQYEWAKLEIQRAEVQVRALAAREAATVAQESALRFRAHKLGEDAITQEDLVNSGRAAQESYLLYLKKREQARMDDALDAQGIVNATIAEQPLIPGLPVWSTWAVLAIGLFGAGIAGTGAAFVADYADPTFRDPKDVLACLNAPVLACVPKHVKRQLSA
jgi:uncharacterized protein involved in exopolysaccharide biosynthesis